MRHAQSGAYERCYGADECSGIVLYDWHSWKPDPWTLSGARVWDDAPTSPFLRHDEWHRLLIATPTMHDCPVIIVGSTGAALIYINLNLAICTSLSANL